MSSTELIVWAMFAAVLIAVIYAYIMQLYTTKLVQKLVENKIHSEDSSLTLAELGYNKKLEKALTTFFAAGNWVLSRAVVKVGGEVADPKEREDLLFKKKTDVKYYIPEENLTKKLNKHVAERMSFSKLVVLVIILLVVAMLASRVIDFLGNYAYGVVTDDGKISVGIEQKEDSLLSEQEELNKLQQEAEKLEEELGEADEETDSAE